MASVKLSGLTTYPIKSAAGIPLSQSSVTTRGLLYDRRWMVCDRSGKFLTQRKFPKMALIRVTVEDKLRLSITDHDAAALELPLQPESADPVDVDVWGDACTAWSMGHEAAQWLSNFLGFEAQLVYMPDSSHRPVDHGRFETPNSFADAYPFLLISEASLADLNERLQQSVPMNRFRPNLVVTGCDPFAEDTWQQIKIGDTVFDVAKSCSRCSIPGVEQSTGVQGKEPLKTLATYRRWDHAIWFGQNLIARRTGTRTDTRTATLRVGDEVKILA